MIVLGIDTSGRNGSVALGEAKDSTFQAIETVSLAGGMYSAQLLPAVIGLLERHGFSKFDIGAFAVASGPGSFTGLRVGLAAVKGLAEVFAKPIAAVSVLEAVAAAGHEQGRTISAVDAARKEVYVGEYDVQGERPILVRESLMTQPNFANLLDKNASAQLITPDASVAEVAKFHTRVLQIERPLAHEYARLGALKIAAGETISHELLDANYIRRSDAEIFAKQGQ